MFCSIYLSYIHLNWIANTVAAKIICTVKSAKYIIVHHSILTVFLIIHSKMHIKIEDIMMAKISIALFCLCKLLICCLFLTCQYWNKKQNLRRRTGHSSRPRFTSRTCRVRSRCCLSRGIKERGSLRGGCMGPEWP